MGGDWEKVRLPSPMPTRPAPGQACVWGPRRAIHAPQAGKAGTRWRWSPERCGCRDGEVGTARLRVASLEDNEDGCEASPGPDQGQLIPLQALNSPCTPGPALGVHLISAESSQPPPEAGDINHLQRNRGLPEKGETLHPQAGKWRLQGCLTPG